MLSLSAKHLDCWQTARCNSQCNFHNNAEKKLAANDHSQKFNPLTYKSIGTHPHILEACVGSERRVIMVVNTEAAMCLSFTACVDQKWQAKLLCDWTLLLVDPQGNTGLMMFSAIDITELLVISIKLHFCCCHNTCAVLLMPSMSFSICYSAFHQTSAPDLFIRRSLPYFFFFLIPNLP